MKTPNTVILTILRFLGHQDWLRYGVRDRIIRRFCNPATVDHYEFEVDFFSMKYNGNLNCYLDWVVYFFGAYEKYELLMLRDLLKSESNPVFINIGANIGHHSLFMSRHCGSVHAFEPYAPVSELMEFKIQRNNISNIIVHKLGLGCKDTELEYFAPRGYNTGTGSFVYSHETAYNQSSEKLQVVNADKYISKLGLDKINLIKIDVEGFEKDVLIGLKKTLLEYRPVVFMEFSTDTKCSFQDEDELISMFPANYIVRTVRTYRPFCMILSKAGYSRDAFDFHVAGVNLIFFPDAAGMTGVK